MYNFKQVPPKILIEQCHAPELGSQLKHRQDNSLPLPPTPSSKPYGNYISLDYILIIQYKCYMKGILLTLKYFLPTIGLDDVGLNIRICKGCIDK